MIVESRAHIETLDGVLILGAGLAGLSAALAAAGEGRRALVISPVALGTGCASSWAQGGMAVAMGADDSPQLHAADTLEAGAGLCDPEAVRILTTEGPEAVRRLLALGAPFDRDAEGRLTQSLEAAHSRPRVARVGGDGAGAAIMASVIAAVRAEPLIEVWESAQALALLTDTSGAVRGALIECGSERIEVSASATLLATGGLGGLYATTTDPAEVRGQGMAMAALAGAVIADPEFVQFHPTAIDLGLDPTPLATEALRGEGARLVNGDGAPFMGNYDPRGDLAPRDVVARAVTSERAAFRGAFLDARTAIGAHFPAEFPAVFKACMAAGVDPRTQLIPVVPAVHYHMGGVWTDLDGRTSLPGLYAAGECASTGVHGANRLASNSLLEAAVFGARAGRAAAQAQANNRRILPAEPAPALPDAALKQLRHAMDRDAGVVRDAAGLRRLLGEIGQLKRAHGSALELVTARLVAEAALARTHSRGAHFRADFPALTESVRTMRTLVPVALMAAE
jgi:L-aspartate oxidase